MNADVAAPRPAAASRWRSPLVVLVVVLALYLGIIVSSYQSFVVVGDEWDYLALAESMIQDRDVDLANQYADVRFKHGFDYRGDGRIRGVHGVGLSIAILPAYAMAGRLGASIVLAVLGALLAALTFAVCRSVTDSDGAAVFATVATVATLPIAIFATQVYTEMPAGLLAMVVVWLIVDRRQPLLRLPGAAAAGLALGAMPWLHAKHVVLAAFVGAFALVWLWRRGARRRSIVLATTAAMPYGLLLLLFAHWYGNAWPHAPYYPLKGAWTTIEGIPTGVVGLLFDRMAGLLPNAPVHLLALPGLLLLARREKFLAALVAAPVAGFLLLSGATVFWWGYGAPGPARFLVTIVPLLAIPLAAVWAWLPSRWAAIGRGVALLLLGIGLAFSGLALADRRLAAVEDNGRARLQEWIWGPAISSSGLLRGFAFSATRFGSQFVGHVGRIVPDRFVYGNQARLAEPDRDPSGFLAFTEGIALPSGRYRAFFRLKIDRRVPEAVARIDLVRHRGAALETIAGKTLSGLDFDAPETWQDFALEADLFEGDRLEPRVYYQAAGARLWFDRAYIVRRLVLPKWP